MLRARKGEGNGGTGCRQTVDAEKSDENDLLPLSARKFDDFEKLLYETLSPRAQRKIRGPPQRGSLQLHI